MTKQQIENYRKNIDLLREKKAKEMEEKAQINIEQQVKPTELYIEPEGDEDIQLIYADWLAKYKQQYPEYKENPDECEVCQNGHARLNFSDPQAEEDFLRHTAATMFCGRVVSQGKTIATLDNGMLIDPRTNREFPEGGYAELVQKLSSGMAYEDIESPKPTTPTPFSMTPF